ncbi:tRNA (adenosine(37)-N6)-threonylcarbamoyltransferase complex dimerization subunit type 1 TsaB [Denitrobaculum tricleocarpae]|uniref:tRNA (Adenosine(37)-N6)-threonylcarbamoyltransferase complex dimerization subunit type 1 TsaB n=1 Tax=Denitrobaculum tricleocarpae TaxID=2591009 RepID=A0A545TRQ2_9PROT|nr:tRNA (adenosine(37)-N6)-threonylcarbamoyltransferase complex dimerization subunit type 1 TsaB [Denitrobaculum tricleocarpae]TQV79907.1 tRNA (adenosine(37)-N6)-threonylcarbamoyltransferase complex dimerization subunit type 1 TsaB [Denitrobaculum tricleocarpae]
MKQPDKILALDAAGAACSAAVWCNGGVAAHCFETMSRGQSERLVPMADQVMAQTGLDYGQLDAIAVTLGPGGFTGVRIGLATARAFALALGIPVIGVSNFEAVAAAALPQECAGRSLAVVLDAKRADLYVQAFVLRDPADLETTDLETANLNSGAMGRLESLTEPAALLPEALTAALPGGPLLLIGDAADVAADALRAAGRSVEVSRGSGFADAARVAALAASRPLPDGNMPAPGPLYLRAPDVTLPGGRPFGARPGAVRSS